MAAEPMPTYIDPPPDEIAIVAKAVEFRMHRTRGDGTTEHHLLSLRERRASGQFDGREFAVMLSCTGLELSIELTSTGAEPGPIYTVNLGEIVQQVVEAACESAPSAQPSEPAGVP